MKTNLQILVLVATLGILAASCKKDEEKSPSLNGTYLVNGKEGTHEGNGTITISGSLMDIDVPAVCTLNDIQFNMAGSSATVPQQQLGQQYCYTIENGSSGTITSSSLILTLKVGKYCSNQQIFTCTFNGSK